MSIPLSYSLLSDPTPPDSTRSSRSGSVDSSHSHSHSHRHSPSTGILPSELFSKLNSAIENRPDKEHLMRQNIIPHSIESVDPSLHSVMRQLSLQQTEDRLMNELGKRPSIRQLVERGILYDSSKGATVQNTQRAILRQMERDKLSEFIANRPSIEDIITKHHNIIEDTMTWTRQVATGAIPLPRNCHTLTSIPTMDDSHSHSNPGELIHAKLYLIGGYGTGQQITELLVFDTATNVWSRPVVAGVIPVERYSHTCSAVGSQLILFGGFSFNGNWLNDIHILDTDFVQPFYPKLSKPQQPSPLNMLMWYQPQCKGTPPSPRAAHSATVIGGMIYIFAGNDGKTLFNDLFILDTSSMTWRQPQQFGQVPPPRAGHTANAIGKNRILIFGGGNANGPVNDLFILNVETMSWSRPIVKGTPPSPRAGHTACTVFGNQLLVFGGGYLNKVFNDLHLFNFETMVWSRPADTGTLPIPRAGHTSTVVGSRIYTFAGGDADDVFNDLHLLDVAFIRRELLPFKALSEIHSQANLSRSRSRNAAGPKSGGANGVNGSQRRRKSLGDLSAQSIDSDRDLAIAAHHEQLLFNRVQSLASDFHTALSNSVKKIDEAAVEQKGSIEQLLQIVRTLEENRIKQMQALKDEIRAAQQNFSKQVSELRDLVEWQKLARHPSEPFSPPSHSPSQMPQPNSIRSLAQFQQILALTNESAAVNQSPNVKQLNKQRDRATSSPPIAAQVGSHSPGIHPSPISDASLSQRSSSSAATLSPDLPVTRASANSIVKEAVSKLNKSEQKQASPEPKSDGGKHKNKNHKHTS